MEYVSGQRKTYESIALYINNALQNFHNIRFLGSLMPERFFYIEGRHVTLFKLFVFVKKGHFMVFLFHTKHALFGKK